jgi:hypothetical protein
MHAIHAALNLGAFDRTLPIPGFKNVDQVTKNMKAMELIPLTFKQVDHVTVDIRAQQG